MEQNQQLVADVVEKEYNKKEERKGGGLFILLGVAVAFAFIGFWIGRGTAPRVTNIEMSDTQCAVATATTTILMEKQRCDAVGGKLLAFQGNLEKLQIICSLPQKNAFEFEVK